MKRKTVYLMTGLLAVLLMVCAAGMAAGETRVTLHNDLNYDKGKLRISWDVDGDEVNRYYVKVTPILNGTATQKTTIVGSTRDHFIETTDCIPGKCYEVTVADSQENVLDTKKYRMEDPAVFEDGKLKNTSVNITMEPRKMLSGEDPKKIAKLKAADIMNDMQEGKAYYGLRYEMKLPQLVKERSFFVTLAFESPDGFLLVDKVEDVSFSRVADGYEVTYWKMAGANFFLQLFFTNYQIPTGEYKVHLYWDGMWVNTSSFTVY